MNPRHANPPSMQMLLSMIQVAAAATALQSLDGLPYPPIGAAPPAAPENAVPPGNSGDHERVIPPRKRI